MRYVIGIIVAVAIYMSITWFTRPKPSPVPQFATTDEMMIYWASQTVESWRKERKIELDYSMDSIMKVEQELARESKGLAGKTNALVSVDSAIKYGAYVGEVLRRHEGGTWAVDDANAGPRSFPMMATNNIVYFPVAWSWILLNGGVPGQQSLTNPPPATAGSIPATNAAPAGSPLPNKTP